MSELVSRASVPLVAAAPVQSFEDKGYVMFQAAMDRIILGAASAYILVRYWRATDWYFATHRKLPRLSPPRGFNEKMFWRKLMDRNPRFVVFNDKIAVRDWISEKMPDLAQTRILWQGTDPSKMPDSVMDAPAMFKCSHGSGFNVGYDGQAPDRAEIEEKLTGFLGRTFGVKLCEWAYSEVPPVAFVEERLAQADGSPPNNINAHCARGEVIYVTIYRGDKTQQREIGFFDGDGQRIGLQPSAGAPPLPADFEPPAVFFDAVARAKILSAEEDYVRVDFMATEDGIWFNEMTTYNASGHMKFDRTEVADELAQLWDLRNAWFIRTPQSGVRELYRRALLRQLNRV